MQNNLARYKKIFQYVYSNIYPEIYCATEKRGFDLKSNFHIMFRTYRDKMQMGSMGKRPNNYENIGKETKTKVYKHWRFNESEEAEVKERVNKQKLKRRKIAENNKFLKKNKNLKKIRLKRKMCGSIFRN